MRGVAQPVHRVEGLDRCRGRRDVADDDSPAGGAYTRHLAQHRERIIEVVERVTGDDNLEAALAPRQRWNVSEPPFDVGDAEPDRVCARLIDHRRRHIDPDRGPCDTRERAGDEPRPAGDIEHAILGASACKVDEQVERRLVADRVGTSERRGLGGELLDDLAAVLLHRARGRA